MRVAGVPDRQCCEGVTRTGCCTGDVDVHDIVVDLTSDAWVVGLGVECDVEFVDEENARRLQVSACEV